MGEAAGPRWGGWPAASTRQPLHIEEGDQVLNSICTKEQPVEGSDFLCQDGSKPVTRAEPKCEHTGEQVEQEEQKKKEQESEQR